MHLETKQEELKKSHNFAQLTKRRGSDAATHLVRSEAGQNLAVVANLYRTSARLVLMQLGHPREIPR